MYDKNKMLKDFDKLKGVAKKVLINYFNEHDFEKSFVDAKHEYAKMIPKLPDIGGKKNRYYINFIGGVWYLAMIKVLEKEGLKPREIGKIIYELAEAYYKSIPRILFWFKSMLFNNRFIINKLKRDALESQLKKYPCNWVFEFVPGDGRDFDYGVNFTECGMYKFYKQEGYEKYMPYLCLGDYALLPLYGRIGFKRTQTIGNGAKYCDFRFKKGGSVAEGWPPENLEEFKLK
jgi:hypothetical protein